MTKNHTPISPEVRITIENEDESISTVVVLKDIDASTFTAQCSQCGHYGHGSLSGLYVNAVEHMRGRCYYDL